MAGLQRLVLELLGFFPSVQERFLVAGGIRADFLRLFHGDREVDTDVTIEVVVLDDVGVVRRVMRGAKVGLAVGEGDPHSLRRPGGLAESLVHDRGVFRRQRLGVHVRVLREDTQRPGVTGLVVIRRAVLTVGIALAPIIEVGIKNVAGLGGVDRRRGRGRRGGGCRSGAGVDRLKRALAGDAVSRSQALHMYPVQ